MVFKRGGGRAGASRILILFLFVITPNVLLRAQEAGAEAAAGGEAAGETGIAGPAPLVIPTVKEPELSEAEKKALKEKEERERFLELDIKTSTLEELAQWCRELGLSEGGGKDDLSGRLRSYYKLAAPGRREKGERVITIESARTTEYFTLETVDEEYARLSGGVEISLQEDDGLHKIRAWDILYNRTRNILSANGGVEYVHEERGTIETFKGDSIIINLDTWVGSFIDTIAERSIAGAETAYRFSGEVISRTDSDTMVLKKARVSNAKSDEPYWSLNASRIWLLPGSDWGIFNAVLKVGEVPVLYLPAFFYPSDDVVFHPTLGTKTRNGYYVQTTTYFLGRSVPDPTKANSISKILGSGDGMEKVREGLFLRTTNKQESKKNDTRFSLMLDAYSQLGFYTGMDVALPRAGVMNHFSFTGGLGWTRTLFIKNGLYTPYQVDADIWESDWNRSYLFGKEMPFRYRFNLQTGISGRFGSIDIKFPLYSDPFIDEDVYLYRSEQFDILQFVRGGATEDTILTSSKLGSYQWSMGIKPNISTSVLAPYISSFAINSISLNLSFIPSRDMSTDAINFNNDVIKYSPSRQFFIPDKFTPYSISANISGSPISTGAAAQQPAALEPKEPLKDIGTPLAPWKKDAEDPDKPLAKSPYADKLAPAALAQSWTLPMNNALRFSLTYNVTPSSAMEMQYNTRKFSSTPPAGTPPNLSEKDISWGDYDSTLMNFRSDGSLNFNLSEANNNLFASSLGFSGSYLWQDHNYINDSLEKKDKDNLLLSDYRGKQWTVNSTYTFTLNPFYWSVPLKSTNFQYTLSGLVARSLFDETKYNDDKRLNPALDPTPVWKLSVIDWDKEFITTHRVAANLGVNVLDKMQNLSFSADMPPLYRGYSASATARAWIWESNANMQIQEDTDENKAAAALKPETTYHYISGYIFRPLYLTQTFVWGSGKTGRFYTVFDPELKEWTNLAVNVSYGVFNSAYTAVRMYKYYYDNTSTSQGWKQETAAMGAEQKLYARDFTLSWAPSYRFDSLFKNLISLTLNSRSDITIDLQRYTYSRFNFSLSLTLGISKFLDFTMGATSENQEIYRYIQGLPLFSDLRDKIGEVGVGKENNLFLDLINSFRFDSEELRRMSGFKLKSFNFSAVHHLGDWDATVSVTLNPYLDNTSANQSDWQYKFRTTFAFLVQWLPITEVETRINYENEKFFRKAVTN